jgi:D-alanyl-D-alanine carboxypeptidase
MRGRIWFADAPIKNKRRFVAFVLDAVYECLVSRTLAALILTKIRVRTVHDVTRGLLAGAFALVILPVFPDGSSVADASEGKRVSKTSKSKSKPKATSGKGGVKGGVEYGCRVQSPQKSLERRNYMSTGVIDLKKQSAAVRYLAERYGHVNDEVTRRLNGKSALSSATSVRFMGLSISVHSKIAPALTCVEKRIQATCSGKSVYKPKAIGGFRGANTYRGIEISNHLFGIAIDVDPDRNPCCGCVAPWPNHPKCKVASKSPYDRADMPRCWIQAFERYGFDWLGHDKLEDTMHFEFLGDPDRIKK